MNLTKGLSLPPGTGASPIAMQGVFGTPLRGMVLAAGAGSRLGGLSDELPKPLLPVCNHPLVTYALALLRGHGITQVAINLHHLGDLIREALGDGKAWGVDIRYSSEAELRGTGGALVDMADWLTYEGREPCVVVNGKLLIDVDLEVVLALHRVTGAAATLVVRETPDAEQWGAIEVDYDGRIHRIRGEASPFAGVGVDARRPLSKCMFTGVQIIEPAILSRLPKGEASCILRQGYIPALREGEILSGYVLPGYFFEHSTPERYLQGNLNVLRGRAPLTHIPGGGPLVSVSSRAQVSPRATVRHPVCIAAGATVAEGAVVGPDVILGEGARVERGVELSRAVVLPGATVRTSLHSAIVTPQAVYPITLPSADASSRPG